MKVDYIKPHGFCSGVKRAIELAQEALANYGSVYCLGELIHNESVVSDLKQKGLIVIDDLKILESVPPENSAVVIRSHGARQSVYDFLKTRGFNVVDATCPIVKKIQGFCRKFSAEDKIIIIYGDKNHHEVQSLMDYCGNNAIVIDSSEEVSQDILAGGCILISQSTKNEKRLLEIYRELHKRGLPKSSFYNTICSDIKTRQNQINSLKSGIDIILVLGSKSSANTANLFSLAKKVCAKSFLVSEPGEFPEDEIAQAEKVVLATGASTPDTFLSSIEKRIKNLYKRGERDGRR